MGMSQKIKDWYDNLPVEEKAKVTDIFEEMALEEHFEIVNREKIRLEVQIKITHPRVQKYLKRKKINVDDGDRIAHLAPKHQKTIEGIEQTLVNRLHAKAVSRYFRERMTE